jgi:hypothetical protein
MVENRLPPDLSGLRRPGRSISRQACKIVLITCLALLVVGLSGDLPRNPAGFVPLNLSASWPSDKSGFLDLYPYLYRRGDEVPRRAEKLVEIVAVGDIMLGRSAIGRNNIFSAMGRWLSISDIALGNFEGVISAQESGDCLSQASLSRIALQPLLPLGGGGLNPYCLVAPPQAAAALQRADFDVLSLANNHTLDLGELGFAETRQRLQRSGISAIGSPSMPLGGGQAGDLLFRRVGELRLAFLAFNTIPKPGAETGWNLERALESIRFATSRADVVIVSIHWGEEYTLHANPAQRQVAQEMVEAGADLIVGHHPHVVQNTQVFERYDAEVGFVAYSLGNFVFDQFAMNMLDGLALRAWFDDQGLRAVQGMPLVAGLHPILVPPEFLSSEGSWKALLERIRPPARRFGFACTSRSCEDAPSQPEWRTGVFWSGQIDLTGDGKPEIVRRVDSRARVYEGENLVWESPSEWNVIDLALGDPNDDGRMEILLTILRYNPTEKKWDSQPFVIGYRGGIYRQLWGGSPVVDPIQEVELGDVDGDGVQEMVVLEQRPSGKWAVSVWRWHGWGFALQWRSQEGRYGNLVLVQDQPGRMLISVERPW